MSKKSLTAIEIPIEAYDEASWNGSAKAASQDAVRAKIETLITIVNSKATSVSVLTAVSNEAAARANADTTLQGAINTNNAFITQNIADIAARELMANKATDFTVVNNTKYPTTKAVDDRIGTIIGTAPANLDTLQEIASQLATDESAVSALTTNVASKAAKSYVDSEITNAKARANHTGTQTASTISDFTSAAQAASPAETNDTIGTLINDATAKTILVDADLIPISDSSASNILKKLTFANLKAKLKSYFDNFYGIVFSTEAAAISQNTFYKITDGEYAGKFVVVNENNEFEEVFVANRSIVGTANIDDGAVTFAKQQNIATNKLLGRSTGGNGVIEQINIGSGLTLTGGTLSAFGGGNGSSGTSIPFINLEGAHADINLIGGAIPFLNQAGDAANIALI